MGSVKEIQKLEPLLRIICTFGYYSKIMKNILIIVSLLIMFCSCQKKHCYQCTTTDYSLMGVNPTTTEKCMTEKQKDKYVKDHTTRKNADPVIISAGDVITICK